MATAKLVLERERLPPDGDVYYNPNIGQVEFHNRWNSSVRVGSVSDFKPHPKYLTLAILEYEIPEPPKPDPLVLMFQGRTVRVYPHFRRLGKDTCQKGSGSFSLQQRQLVRGNTYVWTCSLCGETESVEFRQSSGGGIIRWECK